VAFAYADGLPDATFQVEPVSRGRHEAFRATLLTYKGFTMNRTLLISALLATLSLAACDKPTVVNVPATPVAVPGPAGPQGATGIQGEAGSQGAIGYQGNEGVQGETGSQGATGYQGNEGIQGETGKTGEGTTVIVVPAEAAAPVN